MDVLYFFRHSVHNDFELQHSLRGVAAHMPWIRKVWIFGDRPCFISSDDTEIEHVPHEYLARIGKYRTPVTSFFLMQYLASLIPDLDFEYLWFCDDFFPIGNLTIEEARRDRYINDMDHADRGTGLWKESLWRTYDFLKRLGYPGYNFETHAPTYLTKKRVFEAWCDFRDYVTQDRWYGMLGQTAILNHAVCYDDSIDLVQRGEEGLWVGFYGEAPPDDEFRRKVEGKAFLNCDDGSLESHVMDLLRERFPERCRFESPGSVSVRVASSLVLPSAGGIRREFPEILLPNRNALPLYLNELGLTGEGAEVGVLTGKFSETILSAWGGECLHSIDSWREFLTDGSYVDRNNVAQQMHDRNRQAATERLAPFGSRSRIHHSLSADAANTFKNGSLDFVYIDTAHYYEAVKSEIELWAPKVRPGGILCGHDYFDGVLPSGHFQVKSAVDDWARNWNLTVFCTGEHVWRSWLIQMPLHTEKGAKSESGDGFQTKANQS